MAIQDFNKLSYQIDIYFDAYFNDNHNELYKIIEKIKNEILDSDNDKVLIIKYLYYLNKLLHNNQFIKSFTCSNYHYNEKFEKFSVQLKNSESIERLLFLCPEQSILALEQFSIERLYNLNALPENNYPQEFEYKIRYSENKENIYFLYDKSNKIDYCEYIGKIMPMNNLEYDGLYDYHIPIFKLFEQSTDFNIILTNSYDKIKGNKYIYVHTVSHITNFLEQNSNNLQNTIPIQILKDINDGEAIYILNSAQEGVPIAPYYYIIQKFLYEYINPKYRNNFVILSGNTFEKKTIELFNHKKFIPSFKIINSFKNFYYSKTINIPINLHAFRYFEFCIALQYKRHYYSYTYNDKLIQLSALKFKTFLCFNGHEKEFRYAISFLIWKNDLLKFGSLSLRKINSTKEMTFPKNKNIINKIFKKNKNKFYEFISKLPLIADKKNVNLNYWYQVDLNLINQTFLWIITETTFSDNYLNFSFSFLTEKTYKPIALFMPFIMVGDRYSLKRLKDEGYKTFDKWWNEDYDNIVDAVNRINAIINIIKEICTKTNEEKLNMYIEMKEILEHNHQNLMSKNKDIFLGKLIDNE